MIPLSDFLGKFLNITSRRDATKKAFIESVEVVSHITLLAEHISIKDEGIVVEGTPALKNRLLMDREKILEHFNARSSERATTIR